MAQRFRRDIVEIPSRNFDDLHDICRQRVQSYLHNLPTQLHCCPSCGATLFFHEKDLWCCGGDDTGRGGDRQHWPWTKLPDVLQTIVNKPGWSQNSRMVNSLFSNVIIFSGDHGAGFSYHLGSGPPSLRISGQMYARFMRTPDSCWFVHDSTYHETYSKLTTEFKIAVRNIRSFLKQSNNPFARIAELPLPGNQSQVSEGSIALGVEHDKDHLFCVFVGPGSIPPSRKLYHIGSREAVDENNPLWELLAYIMFHPVPSLSNAWSPGSKSVTGKRLTLLAYLRSVMLHEVNYWKSGRLAHQHVLDTWCRNEQQLAKVWRSPVVQDRIRRFVAKIYGSASLSNSKVYLPASVPGSFRYQQRFFHDTLHRTASI